MEQQWISVKDRYPQTSKNVLVCVPNTLILMGRYSQVSGWGVYDYEKGLVFGSEHKNQVTHWMPLPDPPKKQEQENQ